MALETGTTPILIGNVSGSTGDRLDGLQSMLTGTTKLDAITGDWLSEINLASRSIQQARHSGRGYEPGFLGSFKIAIDDYIAYPNRNLKIVVNAGGLNPRGMAFEIQNVLHTKNQTRKVAYVSGDNLRDKIHQMDVVPLNPSTGDFAAWKKEFPEIILANAYIGCWGIVRALEAGADIVICGRCADASPVMGLAAWWHGWVPDSFHELASCLAAGHLIECGPYVCGGNYGGFTSLMPDYYDLSYPIAEIAADGRCVVQKQPNRNGLVSIDTVRGQFLYELQGDIYLNPDVIADFAGIKFQQIGPNRVSVSGVRGLPAPETLKIAIFAVGGYQAELSVYITGLDAHEKARSFEIMTRKILDTRQLQTLHFQLYGTIPENPRSQLEATLQLRIFAQAREEKALSPGRFLGPIMSNQLQGYPGLTPNHDFRTAAPKLFTTYFPGLFNRTNCEQCVHFLDDDPSHQSAIQPEAGLPVAKSNEITRGSHIPKSSNIPPTNPQSMAMFGPTRRVALGTLVYARSGDKGPNVSVGFFFPGRENAERKWHWLRSFMTVEQMRNLLGSELSNEARIERCEFPGLGAVHFILNGLLGTGVSSTSKMDSLGKNVGEFLRARHVDMPTEFFAEHAKV